MQSVFAEIEESAPAYDGTNNTGMLQLFPPYWSRQAEQGISSAISGADVKGRNRNTLSDALPLVPETVQVT